MVMAEGDTLCSTATVALSRLLLPPLLLLRSMPKDWKEEKVEYAVDMVLSS